MIPVLLVQQMFNARVHYIVIQSQDARVNILTIGIQQRLFAQLKVIFVNSFFKNLE
jgi:hypothetical protein